jgi:hypothetical protein
MPGDLASHHSIHNTNEPYRAMGDDPDETELDGTKIYVHYLSDLSKFIMRSYM